MEIQESNPEELIKSKIEELIAKMGFPAEVEISRPAISEESGSILCNIKTEESSFLIGQYGANLQALQHIARILVRKAIDEKINFILDVNSYRQEKNSSIERLAKEAAEQALREKRAIVLRPMSAYERRIVHMELSKNSQVKTESIGEGEERKVVVKPAELV